MAIKTDMIEVEVPSRGKDLENEGECKRKKVGLMGPEVNSFTR